MKIKVSAAQDERQDYMIKKEEINVQASTSFLNIDNRT
jgi:hypothetical protein